MSQHNEQNYDNVTVITENTVNKDLNQHAQNLGLLATQLGYKGVLTVGALEDGIRFYQQRTVEACLELGKLLLLLKEMTPHGDFKQRIALLNIHERTAQRFMSASLKFSKTDNLSLLKAVGNQSKLLELLVLDDEEVIELNETGSIGDITLDEIETMTASELRKALRDAKADNSAKDNIIKKKDEKLNELDAELTKLQSPAQIQARAESEQQQLAQSALEQIQSATLTLHNDIARFVNSCQAVAETIEQHGLYHLQEQYDSNIVAMFQQVAQLSTILGVQVDFTEMVTPSWLNQADTEQE